LQAQFSQMRPVPMAPNVGPRMAMFPPGVPGVGQQLFYGQPPQAFMNPQVSTVIIFLMGVGLDN
jgi:polyadenylate-binding protein